MAEKNVMRIKFTDAVEGKSSTKTFGDIVWPQGVTDANRASAIKYMGQRLSALTTNTYGETDWIRTINTDTYGTEVINVG